MASKVFMADMKASSGSESLVKKLGKLFYKAGFHELIDEDDFVAIKQHFGEPGNTAFIRPVFTREIVQIAKKLKGKPFLTDANTLYTGERSNSVDHLNAAISNGFSYATVQAPIIIADGLKGKNSTEVEVNLKHFDKVRIGSEVLDADVLISLAHFKGHELAGFGGTFKNIGMGLGSRAGKQMMHSAVLPEITESECIKCMQCVKHCPVDCITINEKESYIDHEICIGCGECVVTCPTDAISVEWESTSEGMEERQVEFTYGIVKDRKNVYINFITNVSPDCDCAGWSDRPIVNDIGILASKDPVALEQASLDLVNQAEPKGMLEDHDLKPGENKFKAVHPSTDGGRRQIDYAAEIGMGSKEYELVSL
jgi:hypothetical protein